MDPHDPYVLPGARNPRFSGIAPRGPDLGALLAGDVNAFAARLYGSSGEVGLDPSGLEFLVGRYDESIHYWDSWFGELMDELERRGLAEETIVVVAADHGEEFLEHGDLKHCRNVFDTTIRVPLVYFVPGAAPRRLRIPATNLDILPTVLDLVSAEAGGARFAGTSLGRWITGASAAPRATLQYSWWGEHRSLSDGLHKLVYSTRTRAFALYRLDRDPGERSDVSGSDRRVTAALASELRRRLSEDPSVGDGTGEELTRQLRALGYLQ
jgi:choline-sulfatase